MQFNSLHYAVFFVVVFALFWACAANRRVRTVLLLITSYYFYMSWNWKYAFLIAGSTVMDWAIGRALGRTDAPRRRRALMIVSLVGNLGVLATFKYFNFFVGSLGDGLHLLGLSVTIPHLDVLLPVGISFYTFQSLSYTIDVYRRELQPARSLLDFAVFVAFFPQLVAGPIVRAAHFLPQLDARITFDDDRTLSGLALMFRGLIKKIVIADTLATVIVEPVFGSPGDFSGPANLLAVYAYAMQIYCDFSAYSDIAIGTARTMGFDLAINFNRPYLALNVRDFWSRWHISLSTWLRDYLYIPLGGNRRGTWNTYRNLAITMLLGGLWHGAAWHFVLWGAFHGAWLMADRAIEGRRPAVPHTPIQRLWRRVLTFHLVCFGWLLFRGQSMDVVATMLTQIGTWAAGPTPSGGLLWMTLLLGYGAHFLDPALLQRAQDRFVRLPGAIQGTAYAAMLALFTAMSGTQVPFIYFQF